MDLLEIRSDIGLSEEPVELGPGLVAHPHWPDRATLRLTADRIIADERIPLSELPGPLDWLRVVIYELDGKQYRIVMRPHGYDRWTVTVEPSNA